MPHFTRAVFITLPDCDQPNLCLEKSKKLLWQDDGDRSSYKWRMKSRVYGILHDVWPFKALRIFMRRISKEPPPPIWLSRGLIDKSLEAYHHRRRSTEDKGQQLHNSAHEKEQMKTINRGASQECLCFCFESHFPFFQKKSIARHSLVF